MCLETDDRSISHRTASYRAMTPASGTLLTAIMSSSGAMPVNGVCLERTRSISHTLGNEIDYIDVRSFANRRTEHDVHDDP